MRILYLDIDSLRPDHLGCYGYHRRTSPNIDRLASQGCRLKNIYTSDSPCLPSRTGFFGGLFGSQTGVVNHGGVCSDLQPEGRTRDFTSAPANRALGSLLARCGVWSASISPFPRRHSAFQMTYGMNETLDTGRGGMENADEIFVEVQDWLKRKGARDNWFLHVNMWDPHTPYDTPASFGDPFESDPIDPWFDQEQLERQRRSYGPHSAREVPHYNADNDPRFSPRGVGEITTLADAKTHIDGYDCGVAYADEYVGRILNVLADLGILEETTVIVSADHGENLGELNVWGDHQTADDFTNHIPAVIVSPGLTRPGSVLDGFFYQLDLAATIVALAGGQEFLQGWQGQPFLNAMQTGRGGRDRLLLSQGAWSLQRSLRWDRWLLTHTRHTGIKDFSEWMLFDLIQDPHETRNLASENPALVEDYGAELREEFAKLTADAPLGDPFAIVESEGGPYHARVGGPEWGPYLRRLGETGRREAADWLSANGGKPRPADLACY